MSSDGVAIRVRNLSKQYLLYDRPEDRLKQSIVPRLQRLVGGTPKMYYRSFLALDDASFEVKRGETVGIVGRNGAGKSTLLQLICGTLRPTSGTVVVYGRIAALLELGAGFNPDFTGRENVYMNSAILGLDREEVDRRFDDIVTFADIGDFLDQPVKIYSSGMYVRLAFAVAACVDADVLIVDEALAVGDIKFQAKCFRRLDELVKRGTTILIVTHSVELVPRYCSRALLLDAGRLKVDGTPKEVVNAYLDLAFGTEREVKSPAPVLGGAPGAPADIVWQEGGFSRRPGYNPHEYRWGSGGAEIVDFLLATEAGKPTTSLASGDPMVVVIWTRFNEPVPAAIYGLTIKTAEGVTVFGSNSLDTGQQSLVPEAGRGDVMKVVFRVDQLLGAGEYLLSVGVATHANGEVVPLDRRYDAIHLTVENRKSKSFGLAAFNMVVEVHEQRLHA
jgi:lipopolysaccharide transport system ATP-binding protein